MLSNPQNYSLPVGDMGPSSTWFLGPIALTPKQHLAIILNIIYGEKCVLMR